jgi:hypothetical protein
MDWRSSLMEVLILSQAKWGEACKDDYLRTLGISLLQIPSGLVLEVAGEFVPKV